MRFHSKEFCKKTPFEAGWALFWSLPGYKSQNVVYKSSTLQPSVSKANYQLPKFKHVQKAKYFKIVFVFKSDTAVSTFTSTFCFVSSSLHFFRRGGSRNFWSGRSTLWFRKDSWICGKLLLPHTAHQPCPQIIEGYPKQLHFSSISPEFSLVAKCNIKSAS